jgi:hypothetical protein
MDAELDMLLPLLRVRDWVPDSVGVRVGHTVRLEVRHRVGDTVPLLDLEGDWERVGEREELGLPE